MVLLQGRHRLLVFLLFVAPFLLLLAGFVSGCSSSSDAGCDCNPSTEDIPYCDNCAV